jgi:hypothetical protein
MNKRYYFSRALLRLSLKIPGKRTPQQGPLWSQLPVSRTFFNVSLKLLIKVLLIKEILPFVSGFWGEWAPV